MTERRKERDFVIGAEQRVALAEAMAEGEQEEARLRECCGGDPEMIRAFVEDSFRGVSEEKGGPQFVKRLG